MGDSAQDIAAELRRRITEGLYEPGSRLPGEHDLAAEFEVSRNTVRAALDDLERVGLVIRRRPTGTTVAPTPRPITIDAADPADIDRSGLADVEIAPAGTFIGDRLALDADDLVLIRRSVLVRDGAPYAAVATYIPYALAQGTDLVRPALIGATETGALAAAGITITPLRDELTPRHADDQDSARLRVPLGAAVLEQTRTATTADGQPVLCRVTVWARGAVLTYPVGQE